MNAEVVQDAAAVQLRRYLDELRQQLWWREGLFSLSRGVAVGASAGAMPSSRCKPSGVYSPLAVVALFAAGSLLHGFTRRPTVLRAARQRIDKRSLRNSSFTAAEILNGGIGGGLVRLQLADASRLSASVQARQRVSSKWNRALAMRRFLHCSADCFCRCN